MPSAPEHISFPATGSSLSSAEIVDRLFTGHAAQVLARFPAGCIDLVVTSPPYWTAVEYDRGASPWRSYAAYIADMLSVWKECARVLRPNGKLCINAPVMPIPKKLIAQHTRHLKNIAFDVDHGILCETELARYALFVWQKQTSKMMFGSYPYPGNIIENNTIEFINVYVKPGKPPRFSAGMKAANALSRAEWLDLTQQVWFMYPHDVKRGGDHPAPFPEKLPARLMRLYTYGAAESFPGEIVLDPFAGTGTTCAVARQMRRRYVGIDIDPAYIRMAQDRLREPPAPAPLLLVGRPRYPGRDELRGVAAARAGSNGEVAAAKHKRKTYGRRLRANKPARLRLV
ncbi:MAG TPA: site-specific DNA-methyltransferase [Xanthobacteraceae bacterium]|jgi:DNA modification methylase